MIIDFPHLLKRKNVYFTITTLIFFLSIKQAQIYDINREIEFIINHPKLTFDEKRGLREGEFLYKYILFLSINVPKNAILMLPPQKPPWGYTGNGGYMISFLYPRKLAGASENDYLNSGATHMLLVSGEPGSTNQENSGWPKIKIPAKKIVYMSLNGTETKLKDYDPQDQDNKNAWGFIEIDRDRNTQTKK